jgi:hypothetical protein
MGDLLAYPITPTFWFFLPTVGMMGFVYPLYIFYRMNRRRPLAQWYLTSAYGSIFAAITLGIVYSEIYGGGDIINYYRGMSGLLDVFRADIWDGLQAVSLFGKPRFPEDPQLLRLGSKYPQVEFMFYYGLGPEERITVIYFSVIGLFTGGDFTAVTIIQTLFCIWVRYRFAKEILKLYPNSEKSPS